MNVWRRRFRNEKDVGAAGIGGFLGAGSWHCGWTGTLVDLEKSTYKAPLGWPLQALGVMLIAAGTLVLLDSFARFALQGVGTPAPLLILKTISLEPQHGWAISERIQQISSGALQVQQGSLYPALHRLERRGWIRARWGASENNRRAKYYSLTATGRKQLDQDTGAWRKLTTAVAQVLDTAKGNA